MEVERREEDKKLLLRIGEFVPDFEAVVTLSRTLLLDFNRRHIRVYDTYSIEVEV